MDLTHEEARIACENFGFRLCSMDELTTICRISSSPVCIYEDSNSWAEREDATPAGAGKCKVYIRADENWTIVDYEISIRCSIKVPGVGLRRWESDSTV